MDLKMIKSELAACFSNSVKRELHFTKKHKFRFDKKNLICTFIFESGEEIFLNLEVVNSHYEKDRLGCNITFGVQKKGRISDIMYEKLKLPCFINPSHLLIRFHSQNITKPLEIKSDDNIESKINDFIKITKSYFQFLQAFIEDYSELVKLMLDYPFKGMIIENKFSFGLIVMALLNDFSEMERWIEMARNDIWFGDFHKAANYETDIIVPVKSITKEYMTRQIE